MVHRHWPLFDLRLTTERLVLRVPTDDDLGDLATVAAEGIHDPASMPFDHPWTDRPSPGLERGLHQWNWRCRAGLSATSWTLGFMVERRDDGAVLGVQDLVAENFPTRRTVSTASWLGSAHQRQGYGTEMRAAVLHLAFDGLGADGAETGAWVDNAASIGVSRALGYVGNGRSVEPRRGEPDVQLRFRLSRTDWERQDRVEVAIEQMDGARGLLGLSDGDPGAPGGG